MTVDPEAVRSVIRQRRETAEAATQGAWKLWGMQVLADQASQSNLVDALLVADTHDARRGLRTFNAEHIAANSPAAVIALCDGALAILDLHGVGHECVRWEQSAGSAFFFTEPCDTVKALARAFCVSQEGGAQ